MLKRLVSGLLFFLTIVITGYHAHANQKLLQAEAWVAGFVPGQAAYVMGMTDKSEGKYSKRGKASAMVTYWLSADPTVHFDMGYEVNKGEPVLVTILDKGKKNLKKYEFIGHQEEAWAPAGLDEEIIGFLKRGSFVIVEGQSVRGTKTKDTYVLKGSSKIIEAAVNKKASHVKTQASKQEKTKKQPTNKAQDKAKKPAKAPGKKVEAKKSAGKATKKAATPKKDAAQSTAKGKSTTAMSAKASGSKPAGKTKGAAASSSKASPKKATTQVGGKKK